MRSVSKTPDTLTLDILQANARLQAEKEQLEHERERLLAVEHERTEFIARISHDLRTPLSSIIGFSDLILTGEGAKLNRRHLDFIQAINRNGHQLLALINDILDLSTLEAQRMSIRPRSVQLGELLADLRAATEPVLLQAGLHTAWQAPEALAGRCACIDRRRMLQVLVNLVDNARKFTPRGGRVTVTLDADEHQARFTVADTGPGIAEADRPRMFRPYAQRGAATGREGVGLGLAIVKAIVDLHGGDIVLDDGIAAGTAPGAGKGCIFRISIPQRAEAAPAAEAERPAS